MAKDLLASHPSMVQIKKSLISHPARSKRSSRTRSQMKTPTATPPLQIIPFYPPYIWNKQKQKSLTNTVIIHLEHLCLKTGSVAYSLERERECVWGGGHCPVSLVIFYMKSNQGTVYYNDLLLAYTYYWKGSSRETINMAVLITSSSLREECTL